MSIESGISPIQRRLIADLVRVESDWLSLIRESPLPFDRSPPQGGWSPAETLLHVILSLEDNADYFRSPASGPFPDSGFRERAGRFFVLSTFRLPPELETPDSWVPKLIMPKSELQNRLHDAKEAYLPLVSLADPTGAMPLRRHASLGAMGLADWTRFLLVHSLHHTRQLRDSKS